MGRAARGVDDAAEDLTRPILEKDDDSTDSRSSGASSDRGAPEEEERTRAGILREVAAYLVLAAGTAASICAILLSPAIPVFVMAGVCLAGVPYSAYKERQTAKLPALRSLNERLKEVAARLEDEIDALSTEIDLLVPEAERACDAEKQLRDIAEAQHFGLADLVDLVKENQDIIDRLQENLRQKIVHDVIGIIVRSDVADGARLDGDEVKRLVLKIRAQLWRYGVEFHHDRFVRVMRRNPAIAQAVTVVRGLVPPYDWGEGNEEDDEEYEMFFVESSDGAMKSLSSPVSPMRRKSMEGGGGRPPSGSSSIGPSRDSSGASSGRPSPSAGSASVPEGGAEALSASV